MSDLVAFILARVAEDEAVARAASPGPWKVDDETYPQGIFDEDGHTVAAGSRWCGEASIFDDADDALHIIHWDPKRVLADCEAKRLVVDALDVLAGRDKTYLQRLKHTDNEDAAYVIARDALKALAQPYRDHPDFDPAWLL